MIEFGKALEKAKEVVPILSRFGRWLRNRIIYRAQGIPRCAVVITPHQELRPRWCMVPREKELTVYARCDWYIHNITDTPVALTGAYLGRKEQIPGPVKLFTVPTDMLAPRAVQPKKTTERASTFCWISSEPERGNDIRSVVDLIDQYGNHYRQSVVFIYDPTMEREENWR